MCVQNVMAIHPEVVEIFHQPHGGATGKARRIHHLGTMNV